MKTEPREQQGSAVEAEAVEPAKAKRRRFGRRRPCPMCVDGMKVVDYKDINFLRRFVDDRGRIEPRRKSGTCAKHQRVLAPAIKRARYIALLPYSSEHIRKTGVLAGR